MSRHHYHHAARPRLTETEQYEASARREARILALGNARDTRPVEIVPGLASTPPQCVGTGYYHTTPGGDICHHPSAYRAAYGRPVYNPSTRAVQVTQGWWDAHTARPATVAQIEGEPETRDGSIGRAAVEDLRCAMGA